MKVVLICFIFRTELACWCCSVCRLTMLESFSHKTLAQQSIIKIWNSDNDNMAAADTCINETKVLLPFMGEMLADLLETQSVFISSIVVKNSFRIHFGEIFKHQHGKRESSHTSTTFCGCGRRKVKAIERKRSSRVENWNFRVKDENVEIDRNDAIMRFCCFSWTPRSRTWSVASWPTTAGTDALK